MYVRTARVWRTTTPRRMSSTCHGSVTSSTTMTMYRSEAENLEHPLLNLGIVDTDRTATKFGTIQNEVISIGADLCNILIIITIIIFQMLWFWSCERMVHCIPSILFIVPFKQREIYNPERCEHLWIPETETITHLDTESTQLDLNLPLVCTTKNKYHVALLGTHIVCNFLQIFWSEEFIYG